MYKREEQTQHEGEREKSTEGQVWVGKRKPVQKIIMVKVREQH